VPDVTILAAAFAGLVSFLSPCVLPLVPGYLSIVSGASFEQLKNADKNRSLMRTVILNSVMFIIGFSIMFICLGATATWLGQTLHAQLSILLRIAGVVIFMFGLHLVGILKINFLYADKRFHNVHKPRGLIGALILGLFFAFGWSPCIGPILGTILTLASEKQTVWQGVLLLASYSLGLGIPFLLTSFGVNRFLSFRSKFSRYFQAVEVTSGVFVMAAGVLIMTNNLARLAGWFSFLNRFVL
jgi:cytochrome c-type biogenesis protein